VATTLINNDMGIILVAVTYKLTSTNVLQGEVFATLLAIS
jgi:hypothetical protein